MQIEISIIVLFLLYVCLSFTYYFSFFFLSFFKCEIYSDTAVCKVLIICCSFKESFFDKNKYIIQVNNISVVAQVSTEHAISEISACQQH